jgi:hypothetical protein
VESGCRLCVGAFGMTVASLAVNRFSRLIYFIKKRQFETAPLLFHFSSLVISVPTQQLKDQLKSKCELEKEKIREARTK